MKHGLLYRIATSIGMYYFLVVLATAIFLAVFGKFTGSEFVSVMLFAVLLALGSNKVADIIDKEDWPTFAEFAKACLWSRGTIVFLITYPILVILFCVKAMTAEFFIGAINGLITAVLADRHIGDKLAEKKEEEDAP